MGKSKGVGGAGCCCGGCWAPPTDARAASTADVIQVQQYCCRCIPKYLCVTLSATGSYDSSSVLLSRFCGSAIPGESPYTGDAIQFRGTVFWDNDAVSINVRLAVVYEQCFIFWEIPEKNESGYRPIDPNEATSSYECGAGQRTEACKNFGGTWELGDRTLTIAPPQMLDISSHIKCGGCKCMCKCLCISIYSRSSTGDFTLTGSNEIVCAELSEAEFLNCDESATEAIRSASWEYDGWRVQLDGGDGGPFANRTINAGNERTLTCDLEKMLRFGDGDEHIIDSGSGCGGTSTWQVQEVEAALAWVMISDDCSGVGVPVMPASEPAEAGVEETTDCDCSGASDGIDVQYESDASSLGVPLSFQWVGRSTGADSQIEFKLWNWSTSDWETIGFVDGRPSDSGVNRQYGRDIDAKFIGTGADLNKVRIRLVVLYGETLYTDLLRLRTTRCCRLKLLPKAGIVPASTLSELDMSVEGNCPSVFKFWNFFDQSGTEWFVSIDCSWCGGTCGGTALTGCCPRPLSRTLFAEVEIDCPTCPNPFLVVLTNTTANVWDGQGVHCNQPLEMTLGCSGLGSWSVQASGAGGCSFAGSLVSADCEPLNIVFEGDFQGGIGCCGVGSMTTSTSMRITIFE